MTAKELKASILQLAVTGKLVPQDPNDEPASVLLERIKAEKAKLVKAGKIKKDKNPSEIVSGSDGAVYEKFKDGTVKDISDELPFEIPTTWRWVRLTDITEFLHRGKSPVYVPKSGCPMFAQKCNQWDGIHLEKCKFCSETKYRSYPVEYHLHDCDVVINSTGTGTLGRVGLFVTRELEQHGFKSIVPDSHVTIVRTPDETLNRFIFLYLRTDLMWKWMNEIADGSTKQKELYTSTLALLLIPIPPTHEQVRIMRKIEKLVPVVEEYGKLEEKRLQLDADLPATLEKSILQEAIQGKLVPQDPNDEPANELLKRIASERKALVKAGKLKRDKGESVIFRGSDRLAYETRNGETVCIQDEIPFEIPDSWEWVRLGDMSNYGQCTSVDTADIDPGTWSLDLEEIEKGTGRLIERKTAAGKKSKSSKHVFTNGTLLYSKLRTYLNKVLVADMDGVCTSEIVPIELNGGVNAEYARLVLMSPYFLEYTTSKGYGIKMPRVGTDDMKQSLIPLPPLDEQKRIVKRVEELKGTARTLVTF